MIPLIIAVVLLTGCAYQAPTPIRTDMRVIIKAPTEYADPGKLGDASYLPSINTCVITLREYPVCLLHEIRHCLEGQWHPGRTSNEAC